MFVSQGSQSRALRVAALGSLIALGAAGTASADTFTYSGFDTGLGESTRLASHPNSDTARTNFLNDLIGVGTEDFESFAAGTTTPIIVNFGPDTATLLGVGTVESQPSGTNGFGRYPISGNNFYEAAGNFSINFSSPQAAFGFYGVDIGDFDGQVTLTLVGGASKLVNVGNPTNATGGGVLYFGIIETAAADQFTSITFGNTNAGSDVFGFDDFTIGRLEQVDPDPGGRVVPTPAALWGGMVLMGGLGMTRRRKA